MNIADFIASQSELGEFDATCSFTLNALKAHQKLSNFQMLEPGLWLLKFVQAAVALESDGVVIKLGRRTVDIEFEAPSGPSATEILTGLLEAQGGDRGLSHILVGLRACIRNDAHTLCWQVTDQETSVKVFLEQNQTEVLDGGPLMTKGVHYHFRLLKPKAGFDFKRLANASLGLLIRGVVNEYRAVVSRAWCSPIPIRLDGRDLNPGLPHPSMRAVTDLKYFPYQTVSRNDLNDICLALRPLDLAEQAPLKFKLPSIESEVPVHRRSRTRAGEPYLQWTASEKSNAYALLTLAPANPSGVYFLHDGVLIAAHDFRFVPRIGGDNAPLDIGLRILLEVGPGQIDLSQFGVIGGKDLARSIFTELRPELEETMARCKADIDRLEICSSSSGAWSWVMDPILKSQNALTVRGVIPSVKSGIEELPAKFDW